MERSLQVDEGLVLRVMDAATNATALLAFHGLGSSARVWLEFAGRCPPGFRLIAPNLRGHGESDWAPDGNYRLSAYVADARALIQQLGLETFVLMGHSLGATIAMRLAALEPDRALGLVIVDGGPRLNREGVDHVRAQIRSTPRSFASPSDYLRFLTSVYPLATEDSVRRLARGALVLRRDGRWRPCHDPEVCAAPSEEPAPENRSGVTGSRDAWLWLERVRCPTLVVRGEGSAVLRHDAAREMEHRLLDGSLAVVRRAGHAVMIDNPGDFAKVVDHFLRKVENAGSAPEAADEPASEARRT